MSGLSAVMYREGKIRATNGLFIFWDVVYPLGYLLVFGVGMNEALGFSGLPTDYHEFFLAGVLGMASFGIASNTAWSFFMDRDNGIFYEMLTYPISRAEYLIGKVLFNVAIGLARRSSRSFWLQPCSMCRCVRRACRCLRPVSSLARRAGSSFMPFLPWRSDVTMRSTR